MIVNALLAIEITTVATVMPAIVADLGGFGLFSWVFSAFLLTQAVTTPLYGRLADLYGRKRVCMGGVALFIAGSIACGFAPSMLALVAARAVQGAGAGSLQALSMIIIGDLYEPESRARMQGYLSAIWGIAALAGPFLGAFIVENLHWALVFWINVPVGALAIGLLAVFYREQPYVRRHRVDYVGAALLVAGAGALMVALVQGHALGARAAGLLVLGGAVVLAAFFLQERRAPEPILPLALWRERDFVSITLGAVCIGAILMSISGFMPIYVRTVLGGGAHIVAVVVASQSIAWSLSSVLSARLMIRASYRTAGVTGAVILLGASAMLASLGPGFSPYWSIAGAVAVGLGMGFCSLTLLMLAQGRPNVSERGVATSSFLFMRTMGHALGAALGGAILNAGVARDAPEAMDSLNELLHGGAQAPEVAGDAARLAQAIADAMREFYLVCGLLAAATLLVMLRLPGRTGLSTGAQPAPSRRNSA